MTTLAAAGRDATWRERAATFATFLTLGLGTGAWAAAIPGIKLELQLRDSDLSVALLALSAGSVLSTLATGALAPRFGTGRTTGVAAIAAMVAFGLPALAGGLLQLCVITFLLGACVGALDISVNAHATDVERRWRLPIMSSFHAAFSLGGLAGAALGGVLVATGWGVAGQLLIPVGLGLLVASWAVTRLGSGARSGRGHGTGLAWPERAAFGLCVISLCVFLIEGAMADWSGVYFSTVVGASQGMAAAGYAAFSIAMVTGRLVGDHMVRLLGPKRVVVYGGALSMLGVSLALAFADPVVAAVGFACVGLGAANVVPVTFSAAARYGTSPSAGVAMVATFAYGGFLSGPPIIGGIAALAGLRVGLGLLIVAAAMVTGFGLRMQARDPVA